MRWGSWRGGKAGAVEGSTWSVAGCVTARVSLLCVSCVCVCLTDTSSALLLTEPATGKAAALEFVTQLLEQYVGTQTGAVLGNPGLTGRTGLGKKDVYRTLEGGNGSAAGIVTEFVLWGMKREAHQSSYKTSCK